LIFAIVITTAGLPVAISKLVSEAEARGENGRIRSILAVSLLVVVISGGVITLLVLVGAPWIARTLLTDERALYALLGMVPIIPVIAVSSVFRGYFQGRQNMSPYALSTIIEQTVRIFTVLLLARYLLPYGIEYAAAGAMIGMVIGELAGMSFLIYSYCKDPKRPSLLPEGRIISPGIKTLSLFGSTFRDLMRIAVPVTASRFVGSLAYAVEPVIVSQSLAIAGVATTMATAMYGQLEGMAIPLIFFPAFITYALSVSLVPAISEAAAQNQTAMVEYRLQQAIRLSLVVSAPSAVVLFVLAKPLSLLLYHQDVSRLMQILAPFTVIHALQGPFASVLQGLDHAREAMRNSIIGAVAKTVLIFLLTSRPELTIDGVALAINCGILIVTLLHFLSLARVTPLTLKLGEGIKLTVASLATGWVTHEIWMLHPAPLEARLLIAGGGAVSVYLALLFLLNLVRKDDVIRLPYVGKWLARLLPR
jgi:stage V sporulation protein B